MKQIKTLFALLFVMMALCCTGVTAFAQTNVEASLPPTAYSEPAETQTSQAPALTPLPEESPASLQEAASEQPAGGNNLLCFAGAGLAVLVFICVSIFCKIKKELGGVKYEVGGKDCRPAWPGGDCCRGLCVI